MGWEGYGIWTCVSAPPLVSSVMPHSLLHLSELPFSICKIKTISTPGTYGKAELKASINSLASSLVLSKCLMRGSHYYRVTAIIQEHPPACLLASLSLGLSGL